MRKLLYFTLLVSLLGCHSSKVHWLERLEKGDYSSVEAGRYPQRFQILRSPTQYDREVNRLREGIERDPRLLNHIAEHFFPEGEGNIPNLTFRFKFAGIDNENKRFILRYFGLIRDPFVFAGYQVQFIFELPSKRFERAWVDQIPLE